VADHWVINASPIILLAKAEVIQFLPKLCDTLVVPGGVLGEVHNVRISDAGKSWLETEGSKFIHPSPPIHSALSNWQGGAGEAEVISWAMQNPGFTAILDDRRARSLATRNGVPVLGPLRVIVLAKQRGFVPAAKPALDRLRGAGTYVTDELIDRAIFLAGEA